MQISLSSQSFYGYYTLHIKLIKHFWRSSILDRFRIGFFSKLWEIVPFFCARQVSFIKTNKNFKTFHQLDKMISIVFAEQEL